MKFFKKIIVKIIHFLGYDLIKISKDFNRNFLGLNTLKIKTIIDIGANRGQFAREALKAFPEAHIYCLEPAEKPLKDLREWSKKQNGRISVFDIALGEKEADLNFQEYSENDEGSSFLRIIGNNSQKLIPMHQTTLDDFIKKSAIKLEPPVLIKIDTQGYDNRVIMGGKETLKRSQVCITEIMYDQEYQGQGTFKEIFSLLDELGFEFCGNKEQHLAKNGQINWSDSIFKKKNE